MCLSIMYYYYYYLYRCTFEDVGPSQLDNSSQHNTNKESDHRPSYASVREPFANVPASSSDEIRSVDVEIQFSTFKQSSPGIACVSLELKKETNNLEPNETSDHTTAQINIGQRHDVNAMSDAKCGAVTFSEFPCSFKQSPEDGMINQQPGIANTFLEFERKSINQ